jgi:hypothetical protein
MRALALELQSNVTLPTMDGGSVSLTGKKVVRIALLHHHPIPPPPEPDPKMRDRMKHLIVGDRLMAMEESEIFVQACVEGGIRLVLFGHKHRQFDDVESIPGAPPVHFLCCPSTLQYETKYPRGFYSIMIGEASICLTLFVHDVERNAFVPQEPMEEIPI